MVSLIQPPPPPRFGIPMRVCVIWDPMRVCVIWDPYEGVCDLGSYDLGSYEGVCDLGSL